MPTSVASMTSLAHVTALIERWYPPATADDWDAVGLVWGDPAAEVRKVLFAVDPAPAVAEEAVEWGADLLVVHHPLLLKPVHGLAATTPKGRTLTTLANAGCALLTAHTNADQAAYGVSESLALTLGMGDLAPLRPAPGRQLDKLVVFVPADGAEAMRSALADAGAGAIGDYDQCTFTTAGEGRFRPLAGADPTIGTVGAPEVVDEVRIEAVLDRSRRRRVLQAVFAAHPYEEPAWDLIELADPGLSTTGTGRVGTVEPTTLADFSETVAAALPRTAAGIRFGGDPDRVVRRVAVVGGAGDFMLGELAHSDVDVFVTSDLRHHPASEFLEADGPALIDVPHWAAEWTWLPVVRGRVEAAMGDTVSTRVSEVVTDPWRARI